MIILFPSGVIYSNQVGGTSCLQPKAEGVYVPLVSELINQEKLLLEYFTGPKWGGSCSSGIDDKDADAIDHILSLYIPTSFIKVNRHRLNESAKHGFTWTLLHNHLNAPLALPIQVLKLVEQVSQLQVKSLPMLIMNWAL